MCNDGTYSPTCGCYSPPPPTPTFPPTIKAEWNFTPNANGTYDVMVNLKDSNPTRYSVTLNKILGGDPGPLVDYLSPSFVFRNIYPGTWYLNTKKDISNVWSTVVYWSIVVPAWVSPTPTNAPVLTPTPTPTPSIDTSISNKSFISLFFEWLGGLFKNKNDDTDSASLNSEQSSYTCDCSKTCTQISTCAEAYYQLDTCGCSVRDGDGDGVPCENLCQ